MATVPLVAPPPALTHPSPVLISFIPAFSFWCDFYHLIFIYSSPPLFLFPAIFFFPLSNFGVFIFTILQFCSSSLPSSFSFSSSPGIYFFYSCFLFWGYVSLPFLSLLFLPSFFLLHGIYFSSSSCFLFFVLFLLFVSLHPLPLLLFLPDPHIPFSILSTFT